MTVNRECGWCMFTGPESEFMAVGSTAADDVIIVHRDQCDEDMTLVCVGCVSAIGRTNADVVARTVRDLLNVGRTDHCIGPGCTACDRGRSLVEALRSA